MGSSSKWFPAGAPRGLLRIRHRAAAFLAEGPLLFIGAVVAIAVLFRLGVGALRPTAEEDEPPPPIEARAPRPERLPATATPLPAAPLPAAEGAGSASTPAEHGPAARRPPHRSPRNKARSHGRR